MRKSCILAAAVLSVVLLGLPGFARAQSTESTRDFVHVA